jgi:hypothetical protein
MRTVSLNLNANVNVEEVLSTISTVEIVDYLNTRMHSDVVDFSTINEGTYDKLIGLINRGTISLELLVGKVAVKNLMAKAQEKIDCDPI